MAIVHRATVLALIAAALALPAAVRAGGEVLWVPDQYATIQEALAAAAGGDRVLVGPGLYREILNLPDGVRLEGDPPGEAVIIGEVHLHFLRQAVISGFTVISDYGGIHTFGGEDIQITGNIVTGGDDPVGPGITCFDNAPLIEGNVISRRAGIGIYCVGSSPRIVGNSLVENGAGEFPRAGIHCGPGSSPVIERNIIAWGGGAPVACEGDASPVLGCNDLFGNAAGDDLPCGTDGGGNIALDPLFCDVAAGDFSLRSDSPCSAPSGCGPIGAFGVACTASPVEETTWGAVKARMNRRPRP